MARAVVVGQLALFEIADVTGAVSVETAVTCLATGEDLGSAAQQPIVVRACREAEGEANVAEGVMRLRYAGTCRRCGAALEAGVRACYDRATRSVTCLDCVAREQTANGAMPEAGVAGASAQREFERRSARREARIRDAHPMIGGLLLALSDDPHSTRAFRIGAAGETKLGRHFDRLAAEGAVVALHDRKILRPRGQIDHIVVGPAAIYVVDAKNYTGRVQVRADGPFGLGARSLYVGRRDCSKLAAGMTKQVTAAREALDGLPEAIGVPIVPVLAFVDADWPLLFPPDEFAGVRIEGESVVRVVRSDGPMDAGRRLLLAHRLADRLPAA